MKGEGMLVGNFELNPEGGRSGRSSSFFFTPTRDHVETQTIYIYLYFSRATLNETLTAKHDGVLPGTP